MKKKKSESLHLKCFVTDEMFFPINFFLKINFQCSCHKSVRGEISFDSYERNKKGAQTHKATGHPELIDADEQLLHCS